MGRAARRYRQGGLFWAFRVWYPVDVAEWPAWAQVALLRPSSSVGAIFAEDGGAEGQLLLNTVTKIPRRIDDGDWLVLRPDGGLNVVDEVDFKASYQLHDLDGPEPGDDVPPLVGPSDCGPRWLLTGRVIETLQHTNLKNGQVPPIAGSFEVLASLPDGASETFRIPVQFLTNVPAVGTDVEISWRQVPGEAR